MKKIAKKALTGNMLDDHPVLTVIVLTLMMLAALAKPCSAATVTTWHGWTGHLESECWEYRPGFVPHTIAECGKAELCEERDSRRSYATSLTWITDPSVRLAMIYADDTMPVITGRNNKIIIKTGETRGRFHKQEFTVIEIEE